MGIPRPVARLLLAESERRPFAGSVLQLGRSFVYLTREELEACARRHGVALRAPSRVELSHVPELAAQGCLSDHSFFEMLGFEEVRSCDVSDWEGADYLLDLNRPIPPELEGKFDVIFDCGTLTHVFDQRTAFESLHRLIRTGGRIIHATSPSNNHVDIGFFMFSPTLFADYYFANGYQLETIQVCEIRAFWYCGRLVCLPWPIYDYSPGCLDHLRFGGVGRKQLGIFTVATKTERSTAGSPPIQGWYRQFFTARGSRLDPRVEGTIAAPASTPTPSAVQPALGGLPLPQPFALFLKRFRYHLRRWLPPKMPPVVARY